MALIFNKFLLHFLPKFQNFEFEPAVFFKLTKPDQAGFSKNPLVYLTSFSILDIESTFKYNEFIIYIKPQIFTLFPEDLTS
jgi:hypothetical protein